MDDVLLLRYSGDDAMQWVSGIGAGGARPLVRREYKPPPTKSSPCPLCSSQASLPPLCSTAVKLLRPLSAPSAVRLLCSLFGQPECPRSNLRVYYQGFGWDGG